MIALALVVALAITAGLVIVRARGEDRVSYDHRHLGRDFAAARKVLTGAFADDHVEPPRWA
ncbi:MAG: hypothetical protein ACRDVN_12885, partial [Jiangellaceae bacterium]